MQHANDVVSIGSAVCDSNRELFGLHQTTFMLLRSDGRPVISIDDVRMSDESRRHYRDHVYTLVAPHFQRLRSTHLPITDEQTSSDITTTLVREGYTGDQPIMLVLPILEPAGLLGAIVCGSCVPFSDELRSALMTMAHLASVRLAQLGVRIVRVTPLLTARQIDVAQLAARAHTNAQIAATLDVSENTVKKHLKDIFERLGISTRVELAVQIGVGPFDRVPVGITHRGHLTIMRTM